MARYFLDMDMSLGEVAEIFKKQKWSYAANGTYGVPSEDGLASQLMVLVADLDADDVDYMHQGRLAVVRDPDIAGTYQVLLTVGYLYDEDVEPFSD